VISVSDIDIIAYDDGLYKKEQDVVPGGGGCVCFGGS